MSTPERENHQSGKSVLFGILGFIIGLILLMVLLKYLVGL